MKEEEPSGWNDPEFMGQGDDNSVFLVSFAGPDGTKSYLRVWVDPEDEFRVQSVRLRLPRRMTATEIRRFPWSDWLSFSDAFAREALGPGYPALPGVPQEVAARQAAASRTATPPTGVRPGRPGRRGHPDEHYRAIAERYLELRRSGVRNPTATIAAEQIVNRNTVAGWLRVARERKYLPPARPGKPG
jgi:hypothetical protein